MIDDCRLGDPGVMMRNVCAYSKNLEMSIHHQKL